MAKSDGLFGSGWGWQRAAGFLFELPPLPYYDFNPTLEKARLPRIRLYDLRHTFATRAAEAGVDLVTLAALLGRSRVQMVMRYAHPSERHQFEAIQMIESRQAERREQERAF